MTQRTIFCDTVFPDEASRKLVDGLAAHRLIRPKTPQASNLVASRSDPLISEAEIAFGQPDPASALQAPHLRWVHLTSAGYTRYDDSEFRAAAARKGLQVTTSSSVYANPCAEHLLAMMLAAARRLPDCFEDHRRRDWPAAKRRRQSFLLRGQRFVILGYGAIARRLSELLAPFEPQVVALRRQPTGDEAVPTIAEAELLDALRRADHVVNTLPENPGTARRIDAAELEAMPRRAYLYNIGRGTTVNQEALLDALRAGTIAGAYLDVTDPEPLPADHPLWTAPNCHITPHSAGGRDTEHVALAQHFLANLGRYERGEPLVDRVV